MINDGNCFGIRIVLRFEMLKRFEALMVIKCGAIKPREPSLRLVSYDQKAYGMRSR